MSTPKVFTKYHDLPIELQRQIVQEAASSLLEERADTRICYPSLGKYACLDSTWKDVIERHTFRYLFITPRDFEAFGIICGKRHGILHYIDLQLRLESIPRQFLVNGKADPYATTRHALGTVMDIMKDWDPKERKRPGLIKVNLDLIHYGSNNEFEAVHHDFSYLPQVPIIGDLHQTRPRFLHPSSMVSLYEKLPNANRLSLQLAMLHDVAGSVQDATDSIYSLRSLPECPKQLSLSGYGAVRWKRPVQEQLQILPCLINPGPRWSDSITALEISCINNVATFLQNAQTAIWPQLNTLELCGIFDAAPVGSRKETGSSVVQGLIGCLPKMPKIHTVKIEIEPNIGLMAMAINLYLGTSNAAECLTTEEKVPFVPDTNNAIARFSRVSIPGHLASELQDVVWRYHGLVVSVFYLSGDFDDDYYGLADGLGDQDSFYDGWDWDGSPDHYWHYQQWNREKDAWECFGFNVKRDDSLEIFPILPEGSDMDVLIYRMGRYWEWMATWASDGQAWQ